MWLCVWCVKREERERKSERMCVCVERGRERITFDNMIVSEVE